MSLTHVKLQDLRIKYVNMNMFHYIGA